MIRTVYFYAATTALFCCFAFCFFLLAFHLEKNQMFGIDITHSKTSSSFTFLRKNLIKRLLVITGFYLLPTLFFIRYFSRTEKTYPLISLFLMISSYALFFLNSKDKIRRMQNGMLSPQKEKNATSFLFSILFTLPFIPIVFDIFNFAVHFDKLPALLPNHWKFSGTIDSFTAKSISQLVFITAGEILILLLFPFAKNTFFFANKKSKTGNGLRKMAILFLNIQMWGFSVFFTELNNSVLNNRNLYSGLLLIFIGIEITILALISGIHIFLHIKK